MKRKSDAGCLVAVRGGCSTIHGPIKLVRACMRTRPILTVSVGTRAISEIHSKSKYGMECLAAKNRLLRSGMPATLEHGDVASSSSESSNNAAVVAQSVQYFITAMDSLKINMTAVDQLHPLLNDLLMSLCKVQQLPPDFTVRACTGPVCDGELRELECVCRGWNGRTNEYAEYHALCLKMNSLQSQWGSAQFCSLLLRLPAPSYDFRLVLTSAHPHDTLHCLSWLAQGKVKIREWNKTLEAMRAHEELGEEQTRQLLFDLETSYNAFMASLPTP